jgi:uroporphyrin-III C-methyltransferase
VGVARALENGVGVARALENAAPSLAAVTVYLVGAGPGDPGLLTVRGAEVLGAADVVVYDRLSVASLLDLAPPGAERISVGKTPRGPSVSQDAINALLVERGRTGASVVRLKGGDPFVFARGGEEAQVLADAGIPFEIVPGITAASGCAAAAGIPLTHRGHATGVRFLTGHCREGAGLDLNWASLADPDTTLVVYMGLANLPEISARLIDAGLPADTPAAAIADGTTERQRVLRTTLVALPEQVRTARFGAPVLIVIGRVVAAMAFGATGERRAEVWSELSGQRGHG